MLKLYKVINKSKSTLVRAYNKEDALHRMGLNYADILAGRVKVKKIKRKR